MARPRFLTSLLAGKNNREFAKFPVISAMAGVNSSSDFDCLQGIPDCLRSDESLSNSNTLRSIYLSFAEQGFLTASCYWR